MRRTHPWKELKAPTLQLQCHLQIVSLLMQGHLGWSHQTQQVTHPMVVWINLLHLDVAHEKPGPDSCVGTGIFVADTSPSGIWVALVGLCVCLHFISYLYTIFWGSTVWIHSTYFIICLLSTTHFGIMGNSLNVVSVVDFWMGEWSKDYLAQAQLAPRKNPKRITP